MLSDHPAVPFSVVARADGRSWIITVTGEVDTGTAPVLSDAVVSLAAIEPRCRVTLDMQDVSFMDSAGLGALIRGYKACEANGATLVVSPMSPAVSRLLEVTGQLARFTAAPTSTRTSATG